MLRVNVIKRLTTAEGPLDLRVDLSVPKGQFVTLFGPSGTGKTTILRMIAGLVKPDEGSIEVDGRVWFDSAKRINLPARKRSTGFVLQEISLFPNMTVRENLEYALDDKKKIGLIDEFLNTIALTELQYRKPEQLSGGQRQRVALIRALLREPSIYLLDEPLAALDGEMRLRLQDEIIRLYRKTNTTTVFVSHDIPEVFKLAGEVFVLNAGKIIKSGPAQEVFCAHQISGKFKFPGEVLEIRKDQGVHILTVLVGNNLVKVVATNEEIRDLSVGAKIIVASKAFNPIILKNTQL